MRTWSGSAACAVAVMWIMAGAAASARAADEIELAGNWKLVLLPFGEDDFYLLAVKGKGEELSIEVIDSQEQLGAAEAKSISAEDGQVTVVLDTDGQEVVFTGAPATKGPDKGRVLGHVVFRGAPYPARLERTKDKKVIPFGERENPLAQALRDAVDADGAKARVEAIEKLLADSAAPQLHQAYAVLLQAAEDAGLTEEQVRTHLDEWFAEAKPYGPIWEADCRTKAVQALAGKQAFAAIGLELAQELDKGITDETPLERQAAIVQALAAAARLAGDGDLAEATEDRLKDLEAKLDADYLAKVPPFKPEPYGGREKPEHDRVVLMELFTGAQCPPCVAADVAFDALLQTYKPTEFVGLQYHLHIPGPDPLTTPDSIARSEYYGVGGTPSTYFNGAEGAPGGGGMGASRAKYDQYIELINGELSGKKAAEIDLNVTRSGNEVLIKVAARAAEADESTEGEASQEEDAEEAASEGAEQPEGEGDDETDNPAAEAPKEGQLRLHVVLTEESIRYIGGNRLRFHHHVVRSFAGGVEGKELVAGQCDLDLTIHLDEVRQAQEEYLEKFTQEQGGFANPLPEIALEDLAIVAFVQDSDSKRVLHAATAAVPEAE
jgi:hypothetical protein